ncbi:hypothetical protein [Hymenobacter cellulosivorans]|uniref:DUF748 domain-containing protein n=1 Tax=Hymenobacter cellulosivorans TaxID=2932249 RepID=A0ABY4F8G2_9BACT|nr:hypothetical protein [Hymenobacter cellulosivorans]UOQ52501.1 hypothetical protein MUN80_22460 [Hymenobacter cellulosivorans]
MNPTSPASFPHESLASAGPPRRRWPYWVGGVFLLLVLLVSLALLLLDPWLRTTLEKQVATQTQGRYRLQIGELHTSLWYRSVQLRNIRLRPAQAGSQWSQAKLPRLLADVPVLRITGIGLGALLRGSVVPIDSVVLAGARLRVLELPGKQPAGQPLHEQLPKHLDGLRIGYLGLLGWQVAYGPERLPLASVRQASFTAQDMLLTAAGAADSQRVGYAAAVAGQLTGAVGTVAEHRIRVGHAAYCTRRQQVALDSVRVWSLQNIQQQGAAIRVQLVLPRLLVSGVSSAELRRRHLRLDSVTLTRPWVTAALPLQPPPPLHEVVAPVLNYLEIAHLRVEQGQLRLTAIKPKPRIQDIQLQAENILLTAAGAGQARRIWYARSWTVRTGRVQSMVSAPVYWLGIRSTELRTSTGLLRANGITIRPTMSPAALARYKGHQTPHITVQAPGVQISGFDFAAFSHHNALLAQTVELSKLRVLVAGDGRFPLNPEPSMVTQESLAKLPMQLNLRRIMLTNGYVATSYVGPKTGESGHVTFNRIGLTLRNVTNNPRLMTRATPLLVEASGWLQNSWYARATFRIPVLDPSGAHSGEGSFGPGSITLLNPVTEPSRLVRFASGDVRRATVQLRGNRQGITGTMRAEYSNLKLTLLSQQGGADQKTLTTKIGSKLLNGILIRDENPRGLGPDRLKVGSMQSRRDLRVSVLSLWRQGLVSGLLNSIGVPKKLAQSISEKP